MVYRDAMTKVPRMEDAKDTDSGKIWSKNYRLQKRDPPDNKTGVLLHKETEDTAQNNISANHEQTTAKN